MQRQALTTLALALALGAGGAAAQNGNLAGVTMRVLDDLKGVDAIVIELDASAGESEESSDGGAGRGGGADRDAAAQRDEATEEPRDLSRRSDEIHDTDRDERGEGRLEDRDVARPAVPPAPPVPPAP
jgi:hypothetical protein